ncbi:MAG TPA: R3H domain-containing nucleic acid-binding protein [Thermoanaerobaculia bacterium]|nr:R3H domain-containing nucleic acid-binding protein [Thermoanaerobaculia bacterium]
MSASQKRYFSGDTLRQALVQAANHFHLDPDEIAYRPIEKRHGFIKNRKKVLIEVDSEAPRRTAPAALPPPPALAPPPPLASTAPAPRPVEPRAYEERPGARPERERRPAERREPRRRPAETARPPRSEPVRAAAFAPTDEEDLIVLPERPRSAAERFPTATGPQADAARKGLALLLSIAGLDLAPTILQGEEGRLEIELSGSDTDRCFEEEGEVLRSIEHLLPRLIRALCGEAIPVRVDCDNFHEIREEQLRTLAQRVAAEVRKRGRPRTLEPMNPADRRVIHMTLADDPGVVTESEGEGYFKRVSVRPA